MGDLDEIITTFPSPLKDKQAKQNIMGQKQQQTKTRKKLKHKDVLGRSHGRGWQSPPHSLRWHQAGWAEELCKVACAPDSLQANSWLPHQLLTARAFPGCLALCCSPSSEFLRASLHIPASCVWAPSWRP